MLAKKQTIKLKEKDVKRASINSSKRSAWESKQAGRSLSEQVHKSPKRKKPKYKQDWKEEDL